MKQAILALSLLSLIAGSPALSADTFRMNLSAPILFGDGSSEEEPETPAPITFAYDSIRGRIGAALAPVLPSIVDETISWSAPSLPPGMTISATNGAIGGTPSAAANGDFPVVASKGIDHPGSVSIEIRPALVMAATGSAILVRQNASISQSPPAVTNAGGELSWDTTNGGTALPGSIAIAADGTLSGNPGAATPANYTIRYTATDAWDGSGVGPRTRTLQVAQPFSVPDQTITLWKDWGSNQPSLTMSGKVGAVSGAILSGSYPAGVSFGNGGLFTVTDNQAVGQTTANVRFTDARDGSQDDAQLTVRTIERPASDLPQFRVLYGGATAWLSDISTANGLLWSDGRYQTFPSSSTDRNVRVSVNGNVRINSVILEATGTVSGVIQFYDPAGGRGWYGARSFSSSNGVIAINEFAQSVNISLATSSTPSIRSVRMQ